MPSVYYPPFVHQLTTACCGFMSKSEMMPMFCGRCGKPTSGETDRKESPATNLRHDAAWIAMIHEARHQIIEGMKPLVKAEVRDGDINYVAKKALASLMELMEANGVCLSWAPPAASSIGGGSWSTGKPLDIKKSLQVAARLISEATSGRYRHPEFRAEYLNEPSPKHPFEVGDRVRFMSPFSGRWFQGVVTKPGEKNSHVHVRHEPSIGQVPNDRLIKEPAEVIANDTRMIMDEAADMAYWETVRAGQFTTYRECLEIVDRKASEKANRPDEREKCPCGSDQIAQKSKGRPVLNFFGQTIDYKVVASKILCAGCGREREQARNHGPCAVCKRDVIGVTPMYSVAGIGELGRPVHDGCAGQEKPSVAREELLVTYTDDKVMADLCAGDEYGGYLIIRNQKPSENTQGMLTIRELPPAARCVCGAPMGSLHSAYCSKIAGRSRIMHFAQNLGGPWMGVDYATTPDKSVVVGVAVEDSQKIIVDGEEMYRTKVAVTPTSGRAGCDCGGCGATVSEHATPAEPQSPSPALTLQRGEPCRRKSDNQLLMIEAVEGDGRLRCRWTEWTGLVKRGTFAADELTPGE